MVDPSAAALFPLPLTTFEKYMLLDDRPDYPMAYAIRLKLTGEVLRSAFDSALEEALSRHPLLCAVVDRSARSGPVWRLAKEQRPIVDWDAIGVSIESPHGERIDLTAEVGLRVWVRQANGAVELTLQLHHACCDGIGSLRFVGDLLAAYGMRTATAGCRPTLHPCDPTSLLRRGQSAPKIPSQEHRSRAVWASIRDSARWLVRKPAILHPRIAESSATPESIPFLGLFCHTFDQAEADRLRQVGRQQGVTVNDLLLRDMLQTLQQWRAEQAPEPANRWLRIAIPVNLRSGDDNHMSAANCVSYTFVTRHGTQCHDSQELLQGVHQEMDAATRNRRSSMFLRSFRSMERIPGAITLYTRPNRCFATTVLSNLGDVSWHFGAEFPCESGKIVAGNLVLDDIFGAPPIRANTRAALMIGRYGGRLWVCVRCDPRAFTADDARELLAAYVDRVTSTVGRAA